METTVIFYVAAVLALAYTCLQSPGTRTERGKRR